MNNGWGPTLRFGRPAEVKTLAEATLFRIRRDIISGSLAPGSKIKSDHLRERYDVGISPLREALFQLVSEGLVRADGQRGFRVSGISRDDLIDVTNWRMKLECEAIELAIIHGDKAWEERCLSAF